MFKRITNLEATTEPAITQNGCYRLGFSRNLIFNNLNNNNNGFQRNKRKLAS